MKRQENGLCDVEWPVEFVITPLGRTLRGRRVLWIGRSVGLSLRSDIPAHSGCNLFERRRQGGNVEGGNNETYDTSPR
jgi:hypothetical protein